MEFPTNTFSQHVENTLKTVFESQNELDSASFDAINYINQNFPNERSLQRVDQFLQLTTTKLNALDTEIYTSVLDQATSGKQANDDVAAVKLAIRDLFQKIKDIKEKAEESEVMVQEISRDIKKLDYAKRHLTTTITGLKRLHMLVTAVDQLDYMARKREYREAANLLNAVNQLSSHFEQYTGVPKVDELRKAVSDTRRALKSQVLEDFRDIQAPSSTEDDDAGDDYDRDQLHDACLVVDALGHEVKSRITERFCCDQLSNYDGIFRSGGPEDTLEAVERRYSWWRRKLRSYEKTFATIFPGRWEVDKELCVDFAKRTRRHLEKILKNAYGGGGGGGGGGDGDGEGGGNGGNGGNGSGIDVGVLLKALDTTLKFEKESDHMFNPINEEEEESKLGRSRQNSMYSDDEEESYTEALYDDNGEEVDPESATGIRLKYKRRQEMEKRKMEKKEREKEQKNGEGAKKRKSTTSYKGDEVESNARPSTEFVGLISTCFANHMGPYVKQERRNMNSKLDELRTNDEVDEDMKTFSTSYNLFGYMHNSIKRCCNYNTGQAFYDLQLEYKSVLIEYASILTSKLVKPYGTDSNGEPLYKFGSEGNDVPKLACYIINTADYCLESMPKLEENVQNRIDEKYAENIDLENEQDAMYDVITTATKVLASGLQARLQPKLDVMAKTNWVTFSDVGDESNYIHDIYVIVEDIVIFCKNILGPTYFSSFCNSFATLFLKKFINAIHRCKRIGEVGAQQLLLDTYGIKTLFLGLREMGNEESASSATSSTTSTSKRRDPYLKRVEEEIKNAESLLKLINYPKDLLASRFLILWPTGTQDDLRSVMALRGMKTNEQNSVLQQSSFTDGGTHASNASSSSGGSSSGGGSSGSSNPLQDKKKAFFSSGFKALERVGSTFRGKT